MFGAAPAVRRTGLVLAAAVIVFSALAAANAVPVGELSVGQIEDELQVFHAESDGMAWTEANGELEMPPGGIAQRAQTRQYPRNHQSDIQDLLCFVP